MDAAEIVQKGLDWIAVLIGSVVISLGFVGWGLNILAVFHCGSGWELAVRLFGVPAFPVGAIVGWL